MRALLPEPVESPDLHETYAADWVTGGGLRVNFIASADGAVTVGGRSRGLQTPGDQAVFRVLRDLADAVVVGRGTAETEGYRPVALARDRLRTRARFGIAPTLTTVVVTATLDVDLHAPLYAGDPAQARTILVTCGAAGADRLAAAAGRVDVIVAGDDVVDFGVMRDRLADRDLTHLLSEGGPTLFAGLAAAGVVDEVCLTVVPLLAGPGPGRIVAGPDWAAPIDFELVGLLEEDGALFHRLRPCGRTTARGVRAD